MGRAISTEINEMSGSVVLVFLCLSCSYCSVHFSFDLVLVFHSVSVLVSVLLLLVSVLQTSTEESKQFNRTHCNSIIGDNEINLQNIYLMRGTTVYIHINTHHQLQPRSSDI